jgi:signal transduction histidine kinase
VKWDKWCRRHTWEGHAPWPPREHPHGFHRHWPGAGRPRQGRLFFRFAGMFGLMVVLVLSGMAALALLVTRLAGGDLQSAIVVWLGGCGLSLALPLLAVALAVRAFRRIAMPLADLMAAADAVAAGDLSVRVPVHDSGDFGRLTASFNRMVEELERADRQRRSLTADVAHELRTPLHIIQGNLEGVLDGVYEPTPEHIGVTLEETRSLARLVDDLQTLSLAEAGQLPLAWETVNVAELLDDAATSFSGQAEAAGIELRVKAAGATRLEITADSGRLNQVLYNLLANALRHTPQGGSVTLRSESIDNGVRIVVRDTGQGISPEDLPHIFERFWRGDRSRRHAGGAGSGLGLAIALHLVRLHHGRIQAQSQPGEGTTFVIELPRENPPPADAHS